MLNFIEFVSMQDNYRKQRCHFQACQCSWQWNTCGLGKVTPIFYQQAILRHFSRTSLHNMLQFLASKALRKVASVFIHDSTQFERF